MQELTPEEFATLLDGEGNLKEDDLTPEQKDALFFTKLLPVNKGAAAGGFKCHFCNGTGWGANGQNCFFCKGTGGH